MYMKKLKCKIGLHNWETHRDTGENKYMQCTKCESRKVVNYNIGYKPIDYNWLSTGKWLDDFNPYSAKKLLRK